MANWNSHLPSTRKNSHPFSSLQEEMNNFFEQFNNDFFPSNLEDKDLFNPKVEIKDSEKQIKVCAELPGLKEDEIKVTLQDNYLVIEGEKKKEWKEEEKGMYRSEFSYGSFHRTIPLADEVKENSVKASYKDGILTIEIEKTGNGNKKNKSIPINWNKEKQ